jgi:hypothetical protein
LNFLNRQRHTVAELNVDMQLRASEYTGCCHVECLLLSLPYKTGMSVASRVVSVYLKMRFKASK